MNTETARAIVRVYGGFPLTTVTTTPIEDRMMDEASAIFCWTVSKSIFSRPDLDDCDCEYCQND